MTMRPALTLSERIEIQAGLRAGEGQWPGGDGLAAGEIGQRDLRSGREVGLKIGAAARRWWLASSVTSGHKKRARFWAGRVKS